MHNRSTPASTTNQHQLPTSVMFIDGVSVSTVARNLGIFIDANLVMRTHVQRMVQGCFAELLQLRQIRNSEPTTTFQSFVVALVISRLDYGNGTLIGLPTHLVRRLQSVQNAAARLIFKLRSFNHTTDALVSLHWLRVPEHVVYEIAVPTFKVLHGIALDSLGPVVRVANNNNNNEIRLLETTDNRNRSTTM